MYPLLKVLRPELAREAFNGPVREGISQGLTVLAGCDRVELDSGMTSQAARRFCCRHRMGAIAPHFAKPPGQP